MEEFRELFTPLKRTIFIQLVKIVYYYVTYQYKNLYHIISYILSGGMDINYVYSPILLEECNMLIRLLNYPFNF